MMWLPTVSSELSRAQFQLLPNVNMVVKQSDFNWLFGTLKIVSPQRETCLINKSNSSKSFCHTHANWDQDGVNSDGGTERYFWTSLWLHEMICTRRQIKSRFQYLTHLLQHYLIHGSILCHFWGIVTYLPNFTEITWPWTHEHTTFGAVLSRLHSHSPSSIYLPNLTCVPAPAPKI